MAAREFSGALQRALTLDLISFLSQA